MTSHYTFCSLLLTAGQVKWRGKLNLKTEEESWRTVLCCRRPNKLSCKNRSNTPGISYVHFPKGGKTKTKMDDLRQDSQTGLQAEYFNTLPSAQSILKHRVSAEVCLLGHQWISGGFKLKRFSPINIREAERLVGN